MVTGRDTVHTQTIPAALLTSIIFKYEREGYGKKKELVANGYEEGYGQVIVVERVDLHRRREYMNGIQRSIGMKALRCDDGARQVFMLTLLTVPV